MNRHISSALPFAVCLLAFLPRIFLLDAQPIWWDEAISIRLANASVGTLLANRAAHVHPPLYFLLLKAWVTLAGDSAFNVRFLSAAANTLLVAAVYAFGCYWLGRRTGLLASVLVASSPLYVIYAQEARVYDLLPLAYLALLAQAERLTQGDRPPAWRDWLLLAGIVAIGLYLHYVFLLSVIYVNVMLWVRLWRRRQRELGRWLLSMTLVALLCLPWVVAVILNWEAVRADAGVDDPFVEPVPLDHFIRLLWTFQWSGLTAAPGYAPLLIATTILAALLVLALVTLLQARETRRLIVRLSAHWFGPLSGALAMWRAKPLSHPRYVALFALALLLLCSYALARLSRGRWAARILAALLGVAILSCSIISLRAYYFDPRFAKDDTRGVAAAIAATATPDSLVLVPFEDWSIPYYYHGPGRVEMIRPGDSAAEWQHLTELTEGVSTVYLVDYYRATFDPRSLLPSAIESAGSLVERWDFKGLYMRGYWLDRAIASPTLRSADAHFAPLRLTGAWVEQDPPADTAVAVVLQWRLEGPTTPPLRVGLRLRDEDGWAWATTDDWLLDGSGLPTDRWPAGQETTTCHLLPLPPGTPPLTYTPAVGVYWMEGEMIRSLDLLDQAGNPRGRSFELDLTSLGPPLGLQTDPYGVADRVPQWETPIEAADELILAGASLDRQTVAPGQVIYATLHWQAETAAGARLDASLRLEQGGSCVVADSAPVGGRYPLQSWAAGQRVVEHRRLVVPATAVDGPATVVLQVAERRVGLGQLEIIAGQHSFAVPPMAHELGVRFGAVAELLGYDLEWTEVVSGQPVPVVLYWQALEGVGRVDYTVFAHLLAEDGHPVAQHDGRPDGGDRPTPGWVPGEIITDRHEMTFREAYVGAARVEVGLYDAATLERVPAEGGETFVLLPTVVTVLGR
jgi:4-amino-4-deoxy-L-arabinose transferase-like glycosyltransferase